VPASNRQAGEYDRSTRHRRRSLEEAGIRGNGHMMMSEKNSDDAAAVLARWLDKQGLD
jgi:hypothetical protein